MTGNWFATFALLFWPLVALWLYHARSVQEATVWTILGGHLLLPVGAEINFEGVPQFDKQTIPNLAALVGCMLVAGHALRKRRRFGLTEVLLLAAIAGPFITSELNRDPIVVGPVVLPGVTHYDALSAVVRQMLLLTPFFLGLQLFRTSSDVALVLRALVMAGLLYSIPMLFEIRMSPQLHTWIYGYFPHSFGQQIRSEGFRPVVFLGHGLLVAFFAMTATVAAMALWRSGTRVFRLPAGGTAAYLGAVLILCKTVSALVYGALLVPLVRFAKPQLQMRIALVLVTIALSYPLLRAADLIPTRFMVEMAASVSPERAASLQFRFEQEQRLLDHAEERVMFGWGRFGRSRLFDDQTGRDVSVTDGRWIQTIGQFGLFGFLVEFGLLSWPVFTAAMAVRRAESRRDSLFLAALAVIVAINMVNLLPNSSLRSWTWLLAGALLGRSESVRVSVRNVLMAGYSSALSRGRGMS